MKTNKIIVVVLLLPLMVISSYGQIDLGVKVGINVSTQLESGVSWSGDDLTVGLNAGGIIRYHVNEWLALKSDISYIQKGRRYRDLAKSSDIIQDRFHYIIMPLKAEISISEKAGLKGGQKLFFAAGPYYGLLLSAEKKDDNTSLNETTENYDYGMSVDLGFEFPVKNQSISFGINYEMGLSKFAKYDTELRNNTISFNVGFIF
mgnify:CR=1 FL=1